MGMNITPLTRPEVPLTTSNLVVDSDLSMHNYNLQANNLHVGGSILQVVECIPSETHYFVINTNSSTTDVNESIVLPFIQSTYYKGSVKAWKTQGNGALHIHHLDGSIDEINLTTTKTDYQLDNSVIAVSLLAGYWSEIGRAYLGFTFNYLPLPTPPEIL